MTNTDKPPRVEFIFDFGSPNAYLSHLVLPALESRTGVAVDYIPCLLGGIFKATNNVSPGVSLQGIKNKPEYQQLETARFLKKHSITQYTFNPHFPVNTLQLMRGAVYARQKTWFSTYVNEIYRHMWEEPKKMDDPAVFSQALKDSDLPHDEILEAIQDPAIKTQLIENTEAAVGRGVFGSPSFFVNEDLFFGKDRLRDIEEAIQDSK